MKRCSYGEVSNVRWVYMERCHWVFSRNHDESNEGAVGGGVMEAAEGEVTMATVREMLRVQESVMKTLFESTVKALTSRVDNLVYTVESLRASLEVSQKDIEALQPLDESLKTTEKDVQALKDELGRQDGKMEYLENQSRRNNIRVNGIPEETDETWDDVERKVKVLVKETLGVDNIEIERAHRVESRKKAPRGAVGNKPRTIVAKLRDWKQRELILRKARQAKPAGVYFSEDLALATLQRREALVPKLKAAKDEGKIAYFVLDRLIIRNRRVQQDT